MTLFQLSPETGPTILFSGPRVPLIVALSLNACYILRCEHTIMVFNLRKLLLYDVKCTYDGTRDKVQVHFSVTWDKSHSHGQASNFLSVYSSEWVFPDHANAKNMTCTFTSEQFSSAHLQQAQKLNYLRKDRKSRAAPWCCKTICHFTHNEKCQNWNRENQGVTSKHRKTTLPICNQRIKTEKTHGNERSKQKRQTHSQRPTPIISEHVHVVLQKDQMPGVKYFGNFQELLSNSTLAIRHHFKQ